MAHAATLNGLAENLVTATTGLSTDDNAFARLKDRTIKGLRDQSHARTNQFAVNESLEGLVEKFVVRNRDDLADRLQSRLEELPTNSKWMPEILSLLLELSDRPVEKTVFADVESANKAPEPEPELTWEDILATDPLDEPDVWDSVDRGYHSSGDDEFLDEVKSERTSSTAATSVENENPAAIARLHLIQPSDNALKAVKAAREVWQTKPAFNQFLALSELKLVRDVLSMLRGLPTDLFRIDDATGRVTLSRKVSLNNISKSSLNDVLESATATGRALNSLRRWANQRQRSAFQQSIQASVQETMWTFGKQLAALESRFVSPKVDAVVSILDVLTEAQKAAAPLMRISLLTQLSSMSTGLAAPFALLDYLYDEVGIAQMSGDSTLLHGLSSVFFAGLRTYLRPIGHWVTAGSLASDSDEAFFVKDAQPDCDPSSLWHSRYELRSQADGTPLSAKCILLLAQNVFAQGKARSFLNHLDPSSDGIAHMQDRVRLPNFDLIQESLAQDTLMPFSQLLNDCLSSWISVISEDCAPALRSRIFDGHGLSRTMDALPHVFFSRNGALFQGFAESLLDRMRRTNTTNTWNDQFLLTELAQTTLGASSKVDSENIYISMPEKDQTLTAISIARKLGLITVGYKLPWPVQNITGCSTPESHSKVFTFLLQLHHAATLLHSRFFDLRVNSLDGHDTLRLRQGLMWLVDLFQNHAATAAHEVHKEFRLSLERAENIDRMVIVWAEYVKRLQTALLLTDTLDPVRDAIVDILELNEALARTRQPEGVAVLQSQFDKSLRFLIAGIRSVSRAGGEAMLEALAERLEWGVH